MMYAKRLDNEELVERKNKKGVLAFMKISVYITQRFRHPATEVLLLNSNFAPVIFQPNNPQHKKLKEAIVCFASNLHLPHFLNKTSLMHRE